MFHFHEFFFYVPLLTSLSLLPASHSGPQKNILAYGPHRELPASPPINRQPHNQKIYRYIREPIRIHKYLTLIYIIYIKTRMKLIKIQNISIKYA